MRYITVGQLREIIHDVPNNTIVLTPCYDHSFRTVEAFITNVLYFPKERIFGEPSGDDEMDREVGINISALIIG